MREMVWKGCLFDGLKAREFENNMKTEKIFSVSKDDIYFLQMCQSILVTSLDFKMFLERKFSPVGK